MQKIEYIDTNLLKLNPDNPRLINDEQFKILCKSIQDNLDYFETRPILCNKDLLVFAGNMRMRAAIEIGLKQVPVCIMDISEERQKEILIRDNIQNGEWQWGKLSEWDEVKLKEWGLDDLTKLIQDEVIEDEAPPMPEIPRTVKGDIYQLGGEIKCPKCGKVHKLK